MGHDDVLLTTELKHSHFLADDGETIHVQISGEVPAIIMLHGWTASHREWSPFRTQLSAHYRVFTWDARGHGGHRLTQDTPTTVKRLAKDLHNLIERYKIEAPVAVGHSMGALILWQYIEDYGCHPFQKLCFIDQSPKLTTDAEWRYGIYGDFDCRRSAEFLNRLKEDFAESVLLLGALGLNNHARLKYQEGSKAIVRARQSLKDQDPAPLIACWKSLTEADYRTTLKRIDIPTLLIYGAVSNFYPPETATYLQQQIDGAVLHVYDTDHFPHQWERDRFIRDLTEFIENRSL